MNISKRLLATLSLLILFAAAPAPAADWVITSESVQSLNGSLASVSPAVKTPSQAALYLDSGSALGYYGPLGPYGPLGSLGPIGSNSWDVSYWISGVGNWHAWSDQLTALGGPLSGNGPLGPLGPLSRAAYDGALPAINDFGKQLQAGGVWTALGPVGPLGALGPLGPLGPNGAHGYLRDSSGRYRNGAAVVRNVSVPYNGASRSYELYENYTEAYAKTATDNDTSFMVEGHIAYPYTETDGYPFRSNDTQYVTIVLTPIYTLDDFDLVVKDASGRVIAKARTSAYVDFVQIGKVAAGTRLRVEVSLRSTFHAYPKQYRLFVVGSTRHVDTATPISGAHQLH